MRRAYNKGDWENARKYAMKIIEDPREAKLAKSVILRSYWNQKDMLKLEMYLEKWDDIDFEDIRQKFDALQKRLQKKSQKQVIPSPDFEIDWNPTDIPANFVQEGDILWFKTPNSWVHWIMPEGFSLQNTHPSLLQLAAELLLRPWNKEVKASFEPGRSKGVNYALSYSAGTDSSAAMQIMPENTILGYHERNFKSMIKHDNAHRLIEHLRQSREVLIVKSNHEHLRTQYGKPNGFSTDYAAGVHLVLLADLLNLKGIAFGTPIDNTWLKKGVAFRDFSKSNHLEYWQRRFAEAGLELIFPINMVTEAGAIKICSKSPFVNLMNSCLRGSGMKGCGKCWKCFHKNGPLGRDFDVDSHEIATFLKKRPIRSGLHAIWAAKKMNYGDLLPDLQHLLAQDLAWWEQYYPPGIEIVPTDLRKHITERLNHYLEPMLSPYPLEDVDF